MWTGWTEITADNDDLTAWLADNADALQKLRQAHSLRHVPALRDTDEPELGPGHFVEQGRYVRQAVAVFGPALFGEMPEWLPNTVHLDLDMDLMLVCGCPVDLFTVLRGQKPPANRYLEAKARRHQQS